ncbi:HMG box-containing protein 1 isoform X2 [Patella vulgata]|uniref:HMG box-containing protein 1 isoform X2 n=1 Tax=Patella vulgata TaxID=6465 RepID=UPI00217F2D7B|nr:HMG box-containing protein 1 isoform X2 [Patella vulgata]
MASKSLAGKRRHVETERMREFRAVGEETRIRRRKCPHEGCNKWFTSNPGLKYHVNTHSPTKSSYKCQNCFRSFISFNGLKYHKKSICKRQSISPKHNPDPEPTVKKKTGPEPARPKRSPPQRPEVKPNRPICRFDDDNRLRDLAIIATGPQSPLLQKTSVTAALNTGSENVKRALDLSCKPKKLPEATTSQSDEIVQKDIKQTFFPSSPTIDSTSGHRFHSWPTAVWQCFLKGTLLNFCSVDANSSNTWNLAEELAEKYEIDRTASNIHQRDLRNRDVGFKVQNIKIFSKIVTLSFQLDDDRKTLATAKCKIDHPFFVKDKGWSSCDTTLSSNHYGIPCQTLEVNDLCLPPSHPDATFSKVYDKTTSYSMPLSATDSTAVIALSSMQQKKYQEQKSGNSAPNSPNLPDSPKAKRPMNGFMLFAKEKRVEYTRKHPGKDNRAISKLLGEEWKALDIKDKEYYKEEAKQLSKQQVKLHPDCWKRKR